METQRPRWQRPPIDPAPRTEKLSYLGTFGHVDCGPRRVEVVQLWLWRDQDGLYAVGTARRFAKGQPLRFARLMVMGAGAAEGDAWVFAWEGVRGASRARLTLEDGQLDLVLSASTPVSDTFAVGASIATLNRDGFGDDS